MKDLKTKETFVELRAQGKSFDAIAAELKVSKNTLITWSRDLKLEIANLKSIAFESLQERFAVTQARRIERLGSALDAMHEELQRRFSAKALECLETDKLLELYLKYVGAIGKEELPLSFEAETELLGFRSSTETWKA